MNSIEHRLHATDRGLGHQALALRGPQLAAQVGLVRLVPAAPRAVVVGAVLREALRLKSDFPLARENLSKVEELLKQAGER